MLLGEKYSPLCVFAVLFLGPECAFCVSHVGTFCFEILYKWKVTVVDICVCVRVSNSLWKTSTPTILKYKIYLMEVLLETRKHVYGRFSLASSHGTYEFESPSLPPPLPCHLVSIVHFLSTCVWIHFLLFFSSFSFFFNASL
jgi:hypothetical protein